MRKPLICRISFRIDSDTDRINHVPDTVGRIHVNILDDAAVHFIQAMRILLQKMNEMIVPCIQFIHTVTVRSDEHLVRVQVVGNNGIDSDIGQCTSHIHNFLCLTVVKEEVVQQRIYDQFFGTVMIIDIIDKVAESQFNLCDVPQLVIVQSSGKESLVRGQIEPVLSLGDAGNHSHGAGRKLVVCLAFTVININCSLCTEPEVVVPVHVDTVYRCLLHLRIHLTQIEHQLESILQLVIPEDITVLAHFPDGELIVSPQVVQIRIQVDGSAVLEKRVVCKFFAVIAVHSLMCQNPHISLLVLADRQHSSGT